MDKEETAFVLWGEGCDEALAVAWVSRLRSEGRRVYLVGGNSRRVRGKYGVRLVCDTSLDQAMALVGQTVLVILPCDGDAVQAFRRDPRFEELLVQVGKGSVHFLAHSLAVEFLEALLPGAAISAMTEDA
jgi:hypothetical protein